MAIEPSHRRFTVRDYHRMAEVGILTEDDHVELIDGEIVQMTPIGGRHVACVGRLTRLLVQRLGEDVAVNIQSPVQLGEREEPEPDAAVIRARSYGDELPTAPDVLLLIEVADTSLGYDRARKLPLYARAGIAESWLVDLQGEAIERHTNPVGGTYRLTLRAGRGEEIASLAMPGLVLRADEVLG
ncbi:MAG: Uma2 family endonuclease [Chloroflexi bacterium]|nr:Uma2 family endonuclease [Chloroflexota bacterium]